MTTREEAAETPAPHPRDRSGWSAFHEQECLVQLREPWIGVTMNHRPVMAEDGSGVRATPVLTGMLLVEEGHIPGEMMLILRCAIPESRDYTLITMHPRDVLYCTHVVQSRIVTG